MHKMYIAHNNYWVNTDKVAVSVTVMVVHERVIMMAIRIFVNQALIFLNEINDRQGVNNHSNEQFHR